eukprot:350499-Chlamydomonas_euryale.AAC.3
MIETLIPDPSTEVLEFHRRKLVQASRELAAHMILKCLKRGCPAIWKPETLAYAMVTHLSTIVSTALGQLIDRGRGLEPISCYRPDTRFIWESNPPSCVIKFESEGEFPNELVKRLMFSVMLKHIDYDPAGQYEHRARPNAYSEGG